MSDFWISFNIKVIHNDNCVVDYVGNVIDLDYEDLKLLMVLKSLAVDQDVYFYLLDCLKKKAKQEVKKIIE